ncbi:extracellular solute-binding protein, partial [Bacillus sp. S34]|nr:extracellular solute-binding protein [Bacillus sp. S34]
LATGKFEGKTYTLPTDIGDYAVVYNKQMFKEAGITDTPTTWAELQADAKKLTKGTTQYGMYLPIGTVVHDENGEVIADMTEPGMRVVIAPGGQGGLGNAALSTTKRKAPGFALLGTEGWSGDVSLELKTIADVALTRVAPEGSMVVNSSRGGGAKDTWIIGTAGDS